jgi:cell division protein FtsB
MSKKQKQSGIPFTQIIAIIAVVVALFLVVDFGRRAAANYQMNSEVIKLEQEVAAERERQKRLLAEKAYVQSDAYIEEVAREELKWGRHGEVQVILMLAPQPPPASPPATSPQETAPPKEHWQEWWDFFFAPYMP